MFLPVDAQRPTLRPADSKIGPGDWEVLSRFWYPVARAADVADTPVACTLLDVDLVLYRSFEGVTAAVDICPHRWVRLSAGQVADGRIVCPYHGLAFDWAGRCVSAPALGPAATPPDNYRVRTFRTRIRYGLVWVCLADQGEAPAPILPSLESYDDSAIQVVSVWRWPISAARQVENFIDLAHLPFVHASTLGGDPDARIEPARVEHREHSVLLTASVIETAPFERPTECAVSYEIFLPFTIEFSSRPAGADGFILVNTASPSSAHSCLVFELKAHGEPGATFGNDAPWAALDPHLGPGTINQQDIDLLAHLRIDDLPLSQNLEIHLPVDNVSTAYRQRLRRLGLGRRAAS